MDEERLNNAAAETIALRVVISALVELYPDHALLRQSIERHTKAFGLMFPAETEEQREFATLIRRKLNTFSELIEK